MVLINLNNNDEEISDEFILYSHNFLQKEIKIALEVIKKYIIDNNLMVNGFNIRPCDDLIKFQVIFSMLYGVIFKLCGQNYIEIANKVMIDLFHIDVSES